MSGTRGRTEALGALAPERTRLGEGVLALSGPRGRAGALGALAPERTRLGEGVPA